MEWRCWVAAAVVMFKAAASLNYRNLEDERRFHEILPQAYGKTIRYTEPAVVLRGRAKSESCERDKPLSICQFSSSSYCVIHLFNFGRTLLTTFDPCSSAFRAVVVCEHGLFILGPADTAATVGQPIRFAHVLGVKHIAHSVQVFGKPPSTGSHYIKLQVGRDAGEAVCCCSVEICASSLSSLLLQRSTS